jgi:hypothetical protein
MKLTKAVNLTKEINLTAYAVEFYDLRQPKPRTALHDVCVIDGGRLSALHRLGQSVPGYICSLYEAKGFGVGRVLKGSDFTASVNLRDLWEAQGQSEEASQE